MPTTTKQAPAAAASDPFVPRHIGPRDGDIADMLAALGHDSLDAFIDSVVPESIRLRRPLAIHGGRGESET
nr:hypothetical protein [Gemmatimonadaceae bacterium]